MPPHNIHQKWAKKLGLRLPYLGNYPPGVSPTAHTNNSEQVYPNLPVI